MTIRGAYRSHKKEHGFTLVELAIVMVIIGLLIGGILKGQELVYSARLNAAVSQVKSYTAAYHLFRDRYNAKPGDIARARASLPGCTAAANCVDGNGNNIIGNSTVAWSSNGIAINSENIQFWKHLAMADMISGIELNAATVAAGITSPISKLRGTIDVAQIRSDDPTDPVSFTGEYFRMVRCATCTELESPMGEQSASPYDAASMDTKMDDGSPNTGSVRSSSVNQHAAAGGCEDTYDWTSRINRCVVYFKVAN